MKPKLTGEDIRRAHGEVRNPQRLFTSEEHIWQTEADILNRLLDNRGDNQRKRIQQLRQYARQLKNDPATHEQGVNILAYLILIEEDK